MGRPKGGTNKSWSKEQKYEYVKLVMGVAIRYLSCHN